ncbi:hypothetical protein EYR36_008781 [Pleurotus pulmonarius]|nr:hypothetical protein EYR36_008781 [Pleurotus pulmonarius]
MADSYGGANLPSRAYDQTGSDKSGVGRGIVFLAWGIWAAKTVAQLDKLTEYLSSSGFSDRSKHKASLTPLTPTSVN